MILTNKKISIPGELESCAIEGIVTSTSSVYDYSLEKTQEEINLMSGNFSDRIGIIEEKLDLIEIVTSTYKNSYNVLKQEPDSYLRNISYSDIEESFIDKYATQESKIKRADLPEYILNHGKIYNNPLLEEGGLFYKDDKIYNFIPGNRYFYLLGNKIKSFTIEKTRRFIWADNILNVRDLGGIPTKGGGHIAYNKIFRGTEIVGETINSSLTALNALKSLGITFDMDLRNTFEVTVENPLNVKYSNIPFIKFEDIENHEILIKQAFETVANEIISGGKVYIHCIWGYHRCGFLCSLIEGILGANQWEIDKDYELSSFSTLGDVSRLDPNYKKGITYIKEKFNGSWIQFALSCGISEELIKDFRNAMVVEYSELFSPYSNVTYSELVRLKENDLLIPGTLYRMIDFDTCDGTIPDIANCSGVSDFPEFRSAYHHFDLLLTALSTNELDCNVKALHSERDNYFDDINLSKWELKYDLYGNNCTWAIGKGVIYYMKDENNNELPYDFKNILFKYNGLWVPTFSTIAYNVVIKPFQDDKGQHLNNNVFINCEIIKDVFMDYNTHDNIFLDNVVNLEVGIYSCYNNLHNIESCVLGEDNYYITSDRCHDLIIGKECFNINLSISQEALSTYILNFVNNNNYTITSGHNIITLEEFMTDAEYENLVSKFDLI